MSVINTNTKSLIAQNALTVNNRAMSKTMEQLSTGKRINGAKDDAAGLAISSKMTAQIKGLNQAVRNANDGISLVQTAEGALVEVTNMLQRMRELSVQSANDTNTTGDREFLDLEFQELKSEINRIGNNTQWNGVNILDKSFENSSGEFKFQVGSNADQTIDLTIKDYRTTGGTNGTAAITDVISESQQTTKFSLSGAFAVGETVSFTYDGQTITHTFAAATADDAAGHTAAATAIAADPNFASLGLTLTSSGADLSFTAAAGNTFSVTSGGTAAAKVSAASTTYSPRTQTSTIVIDGSFAENDKITFKVGDKELSHTVVKVGANVQTNAQIATAVAALFQANDDDATEALFGTSTAVGTGADTNKVIVTGNPTVLFDISSSISGSGGELSMINTSDVKTQANSNTAIEKIDLALNAVNTGRAQMGATINRLNFAADNLTNVSQNASESRSRILDTDYAQATTELARTQIISQAATAMLAQANQAPQSVLSLLR